MTVEIPVPLTYNPYKHHFRFLLAAVEEWRKIPWEKVIPELMQIGNNLIDFYLGELAVKEVANQTIAYFSAMGIRNQSEFLEWLDPPHWKKISLSDESQWLIKQGNDIERYIHIHPAKFSSHTIRVRAITLKTVLALEVRQIKLQPLARQNLEIVNLIRIELLGLSPIKSLRKNESGILRLWQLFQNSASYR